MNHGAFEESKNARFNAVLQNSMSDLLQVAATIKNEAFAEEREVRLISPMINAGDERIQYRAGGKVRIPYVHFRLTEGENSLAIHRIMVGPSQTQSSTQASISELVRKKLKEPCVVSTSKIPYRE